MVNDGGIFTPASVCRTYFSEVSTSSREGGRKRLVNQLVSAQQISAAPNCVVGKYEKAPCGLSPKLYCPKMEYLFFLRYKGSPSFYRGLRICAMGLS